ncbi:MAG: LamG-like jellyroll fold domain-containing protein [Bacteroidaceae bacterium]
MKKYVGVFILAFLSLFVVNSFAGNPPSGTTGLTFNGTNQHVKIASHADLNIAATESFTVSCWVKVSAFSGMGPRILSKRNFADHFIDPTNNATYELWTGNGSQPNHYFANNVVSTTVVNGGTTNNMMSDWIGLPASTGTWYHLCMVIDRAADGGKGDINLYQDGVMSANHKAAGRDFTGWKVDDAYDVLLGCTHDGLTNFSQFFRGEIADVRFYKKALNTTEVNTDMTTTVSSTTAGLVAAYDFKNMLGFDVPDISGHNHTGTLVGYTAQGPVAATPTFSPAAGHYTTAQTVTLTSATAEAKIYYTTNGSEPTISSTEYTAPIAVSANTTIKAIAVKASMGNSTVASAAYTIGAISEYCKKDVRRGGGSIGDKRIITKIDVTGATVGGEARTFSLANPQANNQPNTYVDATARTLYATQGDNLTFALTKDAIAWMHFYLFIDYDHNNVFDADEAVSYTYYNATGKNAEPGLDSKGVSHLTNDYCPDALPVFTIPTTALTGATRIRFIAGWNDINPCGYADMGIEKGTMLDFMIDIASAKKYPVTFTQPSVGGTFTVKNGATAITSGAEVAEGATLTVDAVPATGYKVKTIKVNNVAISGTTFKVTATNVVSVEFEKAFKFDYTFDSTKGKVTVVAGASAVASGDLLAEGSVVTVTVTPNPRFTIKSMTLNGQPHTATSPFTLTINEATTLAVVFEGETYTLTYNTPKYGQMLVTLDGGTTPLNSGVTIPYASYLTLTFSSTQGASLAKLLVNGTDELANVYENMFDVDIFSNIVIEAEFTAPSGIHNSSSDNLITYVNKEGYLVVEGAEIGSLIEVYDIAGAEIAKAVVQSNSEVLSSVQLSTASYLVKISNKSESIVRRVIK